MLGLLGHSTSFAKRKMNLGYRQATLRADCPLGQARRVIRGHEFHYAQMTDPARTSLWPISPTARATPLGASGGRRGNVSGTFFHAIARG